MAACITPKFGIHRAGPILPDGERTNVARVTVAYETRKEHSGDG